MWDSHMFDFTLVAIILSKMSSAMPMAGPKCGLIAALQTRMSTPPHFSIVASASAWSSGLRPMLQAMATASPPFAAMPSTTTWQASSLREETTTLGAVLRQALGDGAADAAAAAGDDGDLAGQVEQGWLGHVLVSSVICRAD